MTTDTLPATRARRTAENGTEPAPRNVHQRIAAVTASVGTIERGSRNQYGRAAIGIDDVEEALSPALCEAGLVTEWSYVKLVHQPTWARGDESVYCARLRFAIVNVDDPQDRVEGEWVDIGSNPMAATSFARKGALKAIFHLAAAEDEAAPAPGHSTGQRPSGQRKTTRSVDIEGRACPECGDQLTAVYRDQGGVFVGHKVYVRDASARCKWRPDPGHQHALLAAAPPDPDPPKGAHALPGDGQPDLLGMITALLHGDGGEAMFADICKDVRFARRPNEKTADWIGRLDAAQRAELKLVLDARLADCPVPM